MQTIGRKVTVPTTPTVIFRCRANAIQTLTVRALAALTLTVDGGTVDDGLPLAADEAIVLGRDDFKDKDGKALPDTEWFTVTAISAGGTSAFIYGFLAE